MPPDRVDYVVEADVVNYIDIALATDYYKDYQKLFFWGLAMLDKEAKRLHRTLFARLPKRKQGSVVNRVVKKTVGKRAKGKHYVSLSLTLVLEGLLGDPVYGGNKGFVGWKMIGFEQHCRRPSAPFGQ